MEKKKFHLHKLFIALYVWVVSLFSFQPEVFFLNPFSISYVISPDLKKHRILSLSTLSTCLGINIWIF